MTHINYGNSSSLQKLTAIWTVYQVHILIHIGIIVVLGIMKWSQSQCAVNSTQVAVTCSPRRISSLAAPYDTAESYDIQLESCVWSFRHNAWPQHMLLFSRDITVSLFCNNKEEVRIEIYCNHNSERRDVGWQLGV